MTIDLVLDAHAELGEGPIWDDERQRLMFVDIMRGVIHEFDPESGSDRTYEVGEPSARGAHATRRLHAARPDGFIPRSRKPARHRASPPSKPTCTTTA